MEKVRKQVMKNKNGRNNKEQHENNIKKKKIESLSQDFFIHSIMSSTQRNSFNCSIPIWIPLFVSLSDIFPFYYLWVLFVLHCIAALHVKLDSLLKVFSCFTRQACININFLLTTAFIVSIDFGVLCFHLYTSPAIF